MKKTIILIPIILSLVLLSIFTQVGRGRALASDTAIQSAMSAAPMSIAVDATILGWPAKDGDAPEVLRKGTNDWLCRPDDPRSPGNDPACYDKRWLQFAQAKAAKTDPKITEPGISYMLQGGSTASNTDPFAVLPITSDKWQADGSHVMVIIPGKWDQKAFPTMMDMGGPYVMWAGTPYEHLMVPVKDKDGVEYVKTTDAKIANAMSAAPPSIANNATILDWPTKMGDPLGTLRKGTNGWTCLPDDLTTPHNDPMCLDSVWMAWVQGLMTNTPPKNATIGVGYMLLGGGEASNTDPFATLELTSDKWLVSAPHIMILSPEKWDTKVYATEHTSPAGPWIMYAGTPYEHLMVPIMDKVAAK